MLLVTGITGHSGRYFLQVLIKNKYEGSIRCIVRETSDTSLIDNSGLDIEKVVGDLNDLQFLNEVMSGVDIVMHIYNIHHSPKIVQAAIKNNVGRAILVHTTGIYSNFKNASEEYKEVERKITELASESDCKTSITILRPTMIFGDLCDHNMSKFIKMIDKFPIMPVLNGGNNLIQPVNARDLGKAYYTVLMTPSKNMKLEAYNLSGDKPIKIIDAYVAIGGELNKKTIFLNVPMTLGIYAARIIKYLTIGKIDLVEKVQRMGENRSYSHENASAAFGYNPMSFEDGIKIEVSEYLQNYKTNK